MSGPLEQWATWAVEHLPGEPWQHAAKAREEWAELEAADSLDRWAEEAVDVILALATALQAMGYPPHEAVAEKAAENRRRCWGQREDGRWQHEPASPPAVVGRPRFAYVRLAPRGGNETVWHLPAAVQLHPSPHVETVCGREVPEERAQTAAGWEEALEVNPWQCADCSREMRRREIRAERKAEARRRHQQQP